MSPRTCIVDGCANRHKGHGYCKKHLTRLKVHGDPNYVYKNQQTKQCTHERCDRLIHCKGYCELHYKRAKRGSNLDAPVAVTNHTPEARIADRTVKDGDCLAWTGGNTPAGYGVMADDGRQVYVHRWVYANEHGPIPAGMQIDHICGNTSCCNVDHLRMVTSKQNQEHKLRLAVNNTSGYRGVGWDKARQQWVVRVKHDGKTNFGGRFATREEAHAAAVALRNELFTHNDADRQGEAPA